METIESPVFGLTDLLDEDSLEFIEFKKEILKYPVNAFGIINKLLNSRGFCIMVDALNREYHA